MLFRTTRCFLLLVVLAIVVVPVVRAAEGLIPQVTAGLCRQIDRQLVERLGQGDTPAQGVSLFMTTPVDINDLEMSMPLARQVQEELAAWFAASGYQVQEIRKGAGLLFEASTGELLLTRRIDLLGDTCPSAGAVVVGTYTITPRSVRFNIRLVKTGSQEILAMANMTIPLTSETAGLVHNAGEGFGGTPIIPTVVTQLP